MLVTNDSQTGYEFPRIIVTINCVLNVPLMLISIFGNTLVLGSVIATSSLRSPSIILLCGLAVSDLGVGLLVQPFYIGHELTSNEFMRNVMTTMGLALCGVSFATMALISVDRYLSLRYHLAYITRVTTPRVFFSLIIVWLVHLLLLNRCWVPPKYIYIGFALIFIYVIAATISYIYIYRIVRHHKLQIHVQHQMVQGVNSSKVLKIASVQQTIISTFVFYICIILCYLPWFIYRLFYGDLFISNRKTAWIFTGTLVFANSAVNPFLYAWRFRELRIAIIKILAKMLFIKKRGKNERFFHHLTVKTSQSFRNRSCLE